MMFLWQILKSFLRWLESVVVQAIDAIFTAALHSALSLLKSNELPALTVGAKTLTFPFVLAIRLYSIDGRLCIGS